MNRAARPFLADEFAPAREALFAQLRATQAASEAVLSAMETIPREMFVDDAFRARSYDDTALPILNGQTISQPRVVAFMTDLLDLRDRHKVLEIGTGTGYQTAILARLARRVYSLERHAPLLRMAETRFAALDLHNVTCLLGDGMKGWPHQAPFDRIIVTACALREPPQALSDQLKPDGGVMVLPIERAPSDQVLRRYRRQNAEMQYEDLMPVRFVPLLPGVNA